MATVKAEVSETKKITKLPPGKYTLELNENEFAIILALLGGVDSPAGVDLIYNNVENIFNKMGEIYDNLNVNHDIFYDYFTGRVETKNADITKKVL